MQQAHFSLSKLFSFLKGWQYQGVAKYYNQILPKSEPSLVSINSALQYTALFYHQIGKKKKHRPESGD